MKQLTVRDIMTTKVFTLTRDITTGEAARALNTHCVGGAPVLDRGRIVGIVSKTDLLDMRTRPSIDGQPTVDDVMTHLIFAVRPEDPALTAVRLMVEEGIHRAVVVDPRGHLEGIISPMDVLRAVVRGDSFHDVELEPAAPALRSVDLREVHVSG